MVVLIWQHARTMANVISRMLNCIEFSHVKTKFEESEHFVGGMDAAGCCHELILAPGVPKSARDIRMYR